MATDDITVINRHLATLHEEIDELRRALTQATALEREATLQDVFDVLGSTVSTLVGLRAGDDRCQAEAVASELERVLPALGLTMGFEAGEVVELWPEEIAEGFIVDRQVPAEAAMVRVEVLANGWNRGKMVVARARGRVLEIINGERDV